MKQRCARLCTVLLRQCSSDADIESSCGQLHRALKQEQNLSAQFFYIFCQACEREISATMEETVKSAMRSAGSSAPGFYLSRSQSTEPDTHCVQFPGTWNRKYNPESSLANPQVRCLYLEWQTSDIQSTNDIKLPDVAFPATYAAQQRSASKLAHTKELAFWKGISA